VADAAVLEQRGTPQGGAVVAAEVVEDLAAGAAHDVAVADEGAEHALGRERARGLRHRDGLCLVANWPEPAGFDCLELLPREHASETGPAPAKLARAKQI